MRTPRVNRLLVRTWNVFHGNAVPPEREAFLEAAIRLATADAPDVVCLQELPLWSLPHLGAWSEMTAVGDEAAPPKLGPLPSTPTIGRVLTDVNHGLLRSAFTGQGNAILLTPGVRVLEHRTVVLNTFSFRRPEAKRLGLDIVERLAWSKERRICQVVRVVRDDVTFVLANVHVNGARDKRIPGRELSRAAAFVDGFAQPDEPVVLAGDFNLSMTNSSVLRSLVEPGWGFAGATPRGIDHILVRGVDATPPVRWPEERRRVAGRLLSDHAPVERNVG
jgi:endonuclease/exonuclease/phosphatase family metal-dependent hydrolase